MAMNQLLESEVVSGCLGSPDTGLERSRQSHESVGVAIDCRAVGLEVELRLHLVETWNICDVRTE